MLTTITSKFQVHIPVAIRKKIGLTKHGRAVIRVEKDKIIIEPKKAPNILDLAGKFKVKNPIPAEKIRDYIDYAEGRH
ncbi:MAG TPA: AbrB/MazE/SpoVT family DNA-binding domain-containing protein [Patescibacteria group bacterium]|nr:AbrB/MazE/SpoVT family DNA-binding domain-containing protein [Patescibacteria group bacterium]